MVTSLRRPAEADSSTNAPRCRPAGRRRAGPTAGFQGVPSGYGAGILAIPGADYSNIKAAEMICDVFHNGGTAADIPFLGFQQDAYRGVLIDGARRFICPDTQH